jgi:Calcineurin-like phosphoesterase
MPMAKLKTTAKTARKSAHATTAASTSGYAFADPKPSPDNFNTFNPKDVFADSGINVTAVPEAIPAPWRTPPVFSLDEILGAAAVEQIQSANQIVFHSVGDTGGVKEPAAQFAVADAMTADLTGKSYASGLPAFLLHLGDVVYYFGQEVYYFDQFYDPYRDYAGPIIAIPGNHDGVMYPKEVATYSLEPFWDSFCTQSPAHLSVAQGCARTTMTQPGVYFTMDAPFVKIIGLYSNTSETVGTIEGPKNDTQQLQFLTAQLQAAVTERSQGDRRAIILAVHHPPFTGSVSQFPSPAMLKDIDTACTQAAIMPDLVLSGHAHLYERYSRTVGGRQIPYIVAGMGGYYNLSNIKTGTNGLPPKPPLTGTDSQGNPLTLEAFSESTFGFLRLAVGASSIVVDAIGVDEETGKTSTLDSLTVNLNFQSASARQAAVTAKSGGVKSGSAHKAKPQARTESAGGSKKAAGKKKAKKP